MFPDAASRANARIARPGAGAAADTHDDNLE
jgi:hypothetical protein